MKAFGIVIKTYNGSGGFERSLHGETFDRPDQCFERIGLLKAKDRITGGFKTRYKTEPTDKPLFRGLSAKLGFPS